MQMKSFEMIHHQALTLLLRLGNRRHTDTRSFDAVAEIHNRYCLRLAAHFGCSHPSKVTPAQLETPVMRPVYAGF